MLYFIKKTLFLTLLLFSVQSNADEILVAVASNFANPAKAIAAQFEQKTGHKVQLSFGATAKFYTQISQGAPFDILLAADSATPARLESEQKAVKNSRFIYAIGRLVLWSADANYVDAEGKVLQRDQYAHLAIANPALAPYGSAAMAVLEYLGVSPKPEKIVTGENIAQTYQFVHSGNAQLGFVALSQVTDHSTTGQGKITKGSVWMIPESYYPPIIQEAVLLNKAEKNQAAIAFLAFLKTPQIKQLIADNGYRF